MPFDSSDDLRDLPNMKRYVNSINISDSNCEDSKNIKLYIRRWIILIIFCLIIFLNSINLSEYNDISDILIKFYDSSLINESLKNKKNFSYFISVLNMITYLVFIFPAIFLLHLKGIWFLCMIGTFLTLFGTWIKFAALNPDLFLLLLIGQILCAAAQPFIITPLVKITSAWFGQYETATAISVFYTKIYILIIKNIIFIFFIKLCLLSQRLGSFLGYLIPPYLIKQDEQNFSHLLDYLYYFYLSLSISSSITFMISIFGSFNEYFILVNFNLN